MEVLADRLILHSYTEEDLLNNCSIDTLKDCKLEWNEVEHKTHKFANDIKDSNIVFSIKDIRTGEEYGYFFFDVKQAPEGNFAYILKKVVLDTNITETYLNRSINIVVELLNNGIFLRKDWLIAKENYPLVNYQLKETKDRVFDEVLSQFRAQMTGLVDIPQDLERKIKDRVEKMNTKQ